MSPADAKSTVGVKIHALAMRVTNLSECKRRYGDSGKTQLLNGVVTAVNAVWKNGRTYSQVFARFTLTIDGAEYKVAEVAVGSLMAGYLPGTFPPERQPDLRRT